MKKIKYLVCMIVVFCTISTVSYAKQVVKYSTDQDGSEENPFLLTLGEGIIDVYYADENAEEDRKESYKDFYFRFNNSKQGVNAANYLLDHNSDKHRVRFTLIGTTEQDLQVASSRGLNYFQAGAKTVVQDSDNLEEESSAINNKENELKKELQIPYYTINAKEKFATTNEKGEHLQHNVTLSNGFIRVDSTLGANVSNYSTSYIFVKYNSDYGDVYTITNEQISRKAKIDFLNEGKFYFTDSNKIVNTKDEKVTYTFQDHEKVNVTYQFNTTHSEISDAEDEQAPLVERILSKIFITFGDALVTITKLGGEVVDNEATMFVTMDSLVFNEYPKTIVDLWGETGSTNAYAKKVVNYWFKVFEAWAIALYIIMLVYIGIKTALSSGTPQQKQIKPMIEGWIVGLLLLFCMPFLFKYVITLNDTLVDIVRTHSKYSVYAYYTFEEEYKSLGGKQDGEDSLTSIVDKLVNAKENLQKDAEQIQETLDAFDEQYENSLKDYKDALNDKNDRETAVKARLDNLNELYTKGTNYQFRKDGTVITVNQIYNELLDITNNYMQDKSYFNDETKDFDSSVLEGLRTIIKSYSEKFMVCYPDGTEADKNINGEEMQKYSDGKMWYTHFLQENIYDSVFGTSTDKDCLLQIYEAEAWVKYYQSEKDKYQAELTKKQEKIYSLEKAIERAEDNDTDLIGIMRNKAGKSLKFLYVLVWLMLVFQVILLLILYYKRLFMIAVLVAIFPLVALAYTYEKTKGGKSTIFRNWMQEYLINVFIQSIHAILYVVLVELGYTIFIADGDNWLIFAIASWALTGAEPIFKTLIGIKGDSTLKGLKDYAKSADTIGLTGLAMVGGIFKTASDISKIDDQNRNQEAEIEKKNAKADKRTKTKRKEEENEIKRKYGEKSSEGKRLLEEKKKREEREDKKKKEKRKRAIKRRRNQTRARMVGRAIGNVAQAGAAVTAALATGNENTAASTYAAIGEFRKLEGGGLTEAAKAREARIDEEAKKQKEATKLGNVETVTPDQENPRPGNNRNGNFDEHNYDGPGDGGYEGNPIERQHSKTFETYRQRLREQRIYTKENWNITNDDKEE